jgi:hypothetical protein
MTIFSFLCYLILGITTLLHRNYRKLPVEIKSRLKPKVLKSFYIAIILICMFIFIKDVFYSGFMLQIINYLSGGGLLLLLTADIIVADIMGRPVIYNSTHIYIYITVFIITSFFLL